MVPVPLGFTERWQVVGYLRALQLKNAGQSGNEAPALSILVSPEQVIAAGSKTDEWLTYSWLSRRETVQQLERTHSRECVATSTPMGSSV